MSNARKVFAVAAFAVLAGAVAPVAEAQPPIRIGATHSQTGLYATPGQDPQITPRADDRGPAGGAGCAPREPGAEGPTGGWVERREPGGRTPRQALRARA